MFPQIELLAREGSDLVVSHISSVRVLIISINAELYFHENTNETGQSHTDIHIMDLL